MGFAADLKSEGTKLLTLFTHLRKNSNRNKSSLEYFGFSLNHFYQVYMLSIEKQNHSIQFYLYSYYTIFFKKKPNFHKSSTVNQKGSGLLVVFLLLLLQILMSQSSFTIYNYTTVCCYGND